MFSDTWFVHFLVCLQNLLTIVTFVIKLCKSYVLLCMGNVIRITKTMLTFSWFSKWASALLALSSVFSLRALWPIITMLLHIQLLSGSLITHILRQILICIFFVLPLPNIRSSIEVVDTCCNLLCGALWLGPSPCLLVPVVKAIRNINVTI